MAREKVDIYRKAVLDAGITGRDWRKNEAYDNFTRFFNGIYNEDQLKEMKYDQLLKISQVWWEEHRSKYS
jgi:hypothetical protein